MTPPETTSPPQPPRRNRLLDIAVLAALLVVCLGVGALGSAATTPNLEPWYASLRKPAFTPPAIAFPIVWTTLYVMMAVAAWRVWRADAAYFPKRAALVAFFVQLVLNAAWSWAFFAAQSPGLGLLVIVLLLVALVWTIIAFARVSRLAAWLLVPYLAWGAFATVLNGAIFAMNG